MNKISQILSRKRSITTYIYLTLPRFLARLPYGSEPNPVAGFDFTEDTDSIKADCARGFAR